ncbi:hypothetical protein P170DRAFT_428976 [Aspergillus steynii IBT 23096]|uniref:BTB domain-containing protein n=1 Tax=Aspergillus steynii IBT 23096 TaxID=1392250 RepID=A0A2I2FYT8_9EURO|nr:uncharacterized protein P170DRAFT_428976 [Aspergillus steynii IBT 23096]PLB45789.1 hypothetical protein P170DRAFT_428976 [Aspergillus steynii IBT 23096]
MSTPLDKSTLSGITRINVGTPETAFDVHIELLRSCSPFFDRLFKDHTLVEIQTNPVPLPNEDPDLFGDLISWLYRGTLSQYLVAQDSAFFLFRLWILGARFEMPGLQNYVISHFLVVMNTQPGGVYDKEKIDYVYDNTQPGSPLRRLAVDMWARNGSQAGFPELLHSMPHAFLGDLCGALLEQRNVKTEAEISLEDFVRRYYVPDRVVREQPNKRLLEDEPEKSVEVESNVPQRATPAQMQRRKIITPKSRLHSSPGPARFIANEHREGGDSDGMWRRRDSDETWKRRRMS